MIHKKAYSHICKEKKTFNTDKEAKQRVIEIEKEGSILYPYKCNVCNGFHLTKKTEKERDIVKKRIKKLQYRLDIQHYNEINKEAEYWANKKGW